MYRFPIIWTVEEAREAAERELEHWAERGCGTPIVVRGDES